MASLKRSRRTFMGSLAASAAVLPLSNYPWAYLSKTAALSEKKADWTGESMDEREPEVSAFLDGEKVELKVEQHKGRWGWYTFKVRPGKHTSRIIIAQEENGAWPQFPWMKCNLISSAGAWFLRRGLIYQTHLCVFIIKLIS